MSGLGLINTVQENMSVNGSPNQIVSSTPQGAVVLSLENGISLGSYKPIAPPIAGLISPSSVGIGTAAPNASAILALGSTSQGFLMPQMTTSQKNAISYPKQGLQVYDTTLGSPSFYNGSSWVTPKTILWNTVTASTAMLTNQGYIYNSAAVGTLTFPSAASVGDRLAVIVRSTGLSIISVAATGQSLLILNQTQGATGIFTPSSKGCAVLFTCTTPSTSANTGSWVAISVVGNWNPS